jgi:hypothetical protein
MSEKFTGEDLEVYLNDIKVKNLESVIWTVSTEVVGFYWDMDKSLYFDLNDDTCEDLKTGNYVLPGMDEYYLKREKVMGKKYYVAE